MQLSPTLNKVKVGARLRLKSEENKKLYNWSWRKASKQFIENNPLCACAECADLVVAKPSEVTDHVKPHRGNMALFWERDNWQPMAKVCHDRKTAREDGGFGH